MGIILKFAQPTEWKECEMFWNWTQLHAKIKDLIFHIPNEEKCINQRRIKAKIGLRRGVSDYFLAYPTKKYHGAFIELKRSRPMSSHVSAEQQAFINEMNRQGYLAVVKYGCKEAVQFVEEYLS